MKSCIIALVFAAPVLTTADECDCVYQGGQIPSELTTQYPNKNLVSVYGTTCAAWDSMPGTPWEGSCGANADTCGDENWCITPWCFVGPNCPTGHNSTVFTGATLFYSYEACGSLDCYNTPIDKHCPYDPHNRCPSGCECLYPDGLPSDKYQGTQYASLANVAYYGSFCSPWDKLDETPWHTTCEGADFCGSANWCELPWCYVSSNCSFSHHSDVFGEKDLYYSYEGCGTPDCYNHPNSSGCPYDPDHSCPDEDCACLYEGHTLPEPIVSASDYATGYPQARAYGTSCAAWDQMPGTPYHEYCDTNAELCKDSWCQTPWCYVNHTTCHSAMPSDVFGETLHYSYEACGSPNCYVSDANPVLSDMCPYDVAGACDTVTCKEVKNYYRQSGCCSQSAKVVDSPPWR